MALGAGSTDDGESDVVSVGGNGVTRQITNVAAGTASSDAATVGQLSSTISGNTVTLGNGLALQGAGHLFVVR